MKSGAARATKVDRAAPAWHLALWWVPAGHRPDVAEARARLERLQRDGPTPEAFTFARRFPPAGGHRHLARCRAYASGAKPKRYSASR